MIRSTQRAARRQRRRSARLSAAIALATVAYTTVYPGGRADVGYALANYKYGDDPFEHIVIGANASTKCSGLTTSELAVMAAAASWAETVDGARGLTPSPMTVGRGDYIGVKAGNEYLYSGDTSAGDQRAFTHTGVGLFQLDTLSNASQLAHWQRMDSYVSAQITTDVMASRYCSTSGSDATRRAYAWGPWLRCAVVNCEQIYNSVYDASTDNFKQLTKDASVTRYGGMVRKDCGYGSPSGYSCYYIDFDDAQGYRGWWATATPLTGNSGISPLSLGFYSLKTTTSTNNIRLYWKKLNTGYSVTYRKWWTAGTGNPRTAGQWATTTSLCVRINSSTVDCG